MRAEATNPATMGPDAVLASHQPAWVPYRTLIENLPIGIIVYRAGVVIYANPHLLQLIHWPQGEEMIGQPIRTVMQRFFVQEEQALGEARLEAAATGSKLPPVERRLRTPDGQLRVAELSTMTVPFESEPAQMTLVRDMTEQRRLAAQLQSQERMAMVGRVAAGVAHELNNPLAFLLGSLELLERDLPQVVLKLADLPTAADAEAQHAHLLQACSDVLDRLREASEGGRRVHAIMQDLRIISQPAGQPVRPLDLRRPLQSAIALARRDVHRKARLVVELQETPPVDGDESRLCQVFLNLLLHATEALPAHGEPIHEVTVRLYPRDAEAVVEIADSGLGLPADQASLLFDPFHPERASRQGAGLDLTVCRDIVVQHKGQIAADSQPGQGLRIRVALPVSLTVQQQQRRPVAPAAPRAKVLIVDDEPQVSAILRQVLQAEHEVVERASAAAALAEIAQGQRFDAILCDLMMPGMSGPEFYAKLQQEAPEQAARVAFVTGGAYTTAAHRFLQTSGRPTLDKPFTFADVRQTVRELAAQPWAT